MKNLKQIKLMMERLESPRMTQTEVDKKKKEILDETASENLELKSLAKKLYLGFKNMGAKVSMGNDKSIKKIGHDWATKGTPPDDDVYIWVQESFGDKLFVTLWGEEAISFIPKIQQSFPQFEFEEDHGEGVRFVDNAKTRTIAISPGKKTS